MSFSLTHNSENTGSQWQFEFNEDFEIERAFLNNKKVVLTKKAEWKMFLALNKKYNLEEIKANAKNIN